MKQCFRPPAQATAGGFAETPKTRRERDCTSRRVCAVARRSKRAQNGAVQRALVVPDCPDGTGRVGRVQSAALRSYRSLADCVQKGRRHAVDAETVRGDVPMANGFLSKRFTLGCTADWRAGREGVNWWEKRREQHKKKEQRKDLLRYVSGTCSFWAGALSPGSDLDGSLLSVAGVCAVAVTTTFFSALRARGWKRDALLACSNSSLAMSTASTPRRLCPVDTEASIAALSGVNGDCPSSRCSSYSHSSPDSSSGHGRSSRNRSPTPSAALGPTHCSSNACRSSAAVAPSVSAVFSRKCSCALSATASSSSAAARRTGSPMHTSSDPHATAACTKPCDTTDTMRRSCSSARTSASASAAQREGDATGRTALNATTTRPPTTLASSPLCRAATAAIVSSTSGKLGTGGARSRALHPSAGSSSMTSSPMRRRTETPVCAESADATPPPSLRGWRPEFVDGCDRRSKSPWRRSDAGPWSFAEVRTKRHSSSSSSSRRRIGASRGTMRHAVASANSSVAVTSPARVASTPMAAAATPEPKKL
mmetsp:Transcript_21171/g.65764  ORF Transcript_21171/g.65764 Transcript_21171/m.65764 type:complete len:538 (-) Transcript_21171:999-2612(-)